MKSLFIVFVFFGSFCFAQAPATSFDTLEVFLSIKHHDPVIYNDVKNTMLSMPGLNYFTYCDNHSVFMVYVNKNLYSDKSVFLEQLQKLRPEYSDRFLLMSGVFNDLVNFCSPSNETDASNLKNSFN